MSYHSEGQGARGEGREITAIGSRSTVHGPRFLSGFTLMELLVTVSIVGILVSIAVPSYRKTIERSYWRGAQDILQTIYAGEWVYKSKTVPEVFMSPTPTTWSDIYMDNPNGGVIPVTFTVAIAGGGSTFIATATRDGGPCNGLTQTLDQSRTAGGSWPSSGVCP